jgi:hypothetical protein
MTFRPLPPFILLLQEKRDQLHSMLESATEEQQKQNFYRSDPGLCQYMSMLKAQISILDWVINLST